MDKNQEMFPPAGVQTTPVPLVPFLHYVPVFLWKCMWRGAQIPKKPGTVRSVTLYIINLKILKNLKIIKIGVPKPPFYGDVTCDFL